MDAQPMEQRPNIGLSYAIEVYDKDGNKKSHHEDEARCFVENFFKVLLGYYLNGGSHSVAEPMVRIPFLKTDGSTISTHCEMARVQGGSYYGGYQATAAEGDAGRGVVIGAGVTAVTPVDFSLQSIVPHGEVDGSVIYGTSGLDYEEGQGEMVLTFWRSFVNRGQTPVSISEIGLYQYTVGGSIMTIRDVLQSAIALGADEMCMVFYKVKFN